MADNSWIDYRFRDVCLGIFDGPHATPKKTSAGPVFLGISSLVNGRLDLSEIEHLSESDFQKWTRRVLPQKDDLVFSYETRIGEAALIPRQLRCCLGRRMALARPNPNKVVPRFLLYYYIAPKFQAFLSSRTVHGSTVDRIPLLDFPDFPLRLPSLEVQRQITDILGTLDDKIELNRQTNETLEAMARALFKSWFVDFDPVREIAAGRRPAGIDAATARLFPSEFEDAPGGKVPKGWLVMPLPEAIQVNPTRSLSKGVVAPYLEMGNMPTASARAIAWEKRQFGSGMRFINGDTLVARITPCLENGKTAYVDFLRDGEVGWGSTEYIVLRSKPPLPATYSYFLARTDDFRSHVIKNMTGTSGRQRAPAECLDQYLVAVPDPKVSARFGEFADHCLALMKKNDEESATLAATRDSLLPKLLNGEIEVSGVSASGSSR